jgi:hypothetical protein
MYLCSYFQITIISRLPHPQQYQHAVLKLSTSFPCCKRLRFTSIQNYMQIYIYIYMLIYIWPLTVREEH